MSHVTETSGTLKTQPMAQAPHTQGLVALAEHSVCTGLSPVTQQWVRSAVPLGRTWTLALEDNLPSFDFLHEDLDQGLLRPQGKAMFLEDQE